MKSFIVACALLSSFAHAESLKVNVKNFNFTYADPFGDGTATSFSRNLTQESVSVRVEKVAEDFHLSTSGAENHEFVFKDAPAFMTEAETMTVKGFNLNFSQALTMSLSSGRFLSKEDHLKLDGLNLSCERDNNHSHEMDQIISGCMNKMSLKASKFSQDSAKRSVANILNEAFGVNDLEKANIGVNSLDLKTQSGKYELEGDVKAQISGKVRSKGNMSYDAVKGIMTIKISEVKFGFLNITGKVFDELKKNESDKLKVKQPFVYFTLK